jgi:MFS family permease
MASNFWQIGMARMGVGIGEAGGSPPSHSIISDMYPKEERAGALGFYSMGIPFGIMAAYFATASLMGSGGDVEWRRIFIFLGITGIVLAGIVKLTLKEPVRGAQELDGGTQIKKLPFIESLKSLLKIPAWWAMCFGIAFGSFVSYASSAFQTKFLIALDPSFDFKTMVILLGIMNGTTYAGGAFFGAKLADKWGAKTIRAYGWLPAIAMTVCLPLGIWSYWVQSVEANLILSTIYLLFIGIYLGPSFAIAQTLAPINMRAMSTALFFFILNMVALGGGPTFAGWLIDVFKADYSELEAMRMAMTVTHLVFIPALISFLVVSRILPRDWKAAEERNIKLESS